MRTAAYRRNLDAEVRAVEEGHRALVLPGGAVKVVSDTMPDKHYVVRFFALRGARIVFECHPEGTGCYHGDHLLTTAQPGVLPCKHAAVAARRLRREGLAHLDADGLWVSDAPEHRHQFTAGRCACGEPEDPFAGL